MARSDPKPTESIGQRVQRYRVDAGMSAAELAAVADVSRSYLSELESGRGSAQRPSAETLYALARALGVTMSDLLGKPVLLDPASRKKPSPSLLAFAKERGLPVADLEMLAGITFRGAPPRTPERWAFIYEAIRNSQRMDRD